MTEPPKPPNQPPTPSGYGHLPGPPQPGWGHHPAVAGGGYPQQGENPYAQQPPTQPMHPAQPAPPMPQQGYLPPPPGAPTAAMQQAGGMPPKKKTAVLIAAAVAGVLVLAAGGYFAFAGGSDEDPKKPVAQSSAPADAKPSGEVDKGDGSGNGSKAGEDLNAGRKQGEDKALWLRTAKIDGPGMGVESAGQWIVGDTVVKSVWKNLTAYGVTDGKEKWTLAFPNPICSVTRQTTAESKTVVMFKDGDGDNATCNQMKQVDLKAGKEGWTKEVPSEGLFDIMTFPSLGITGDTVAVSRSGTASAFKVSTGDKLFGSATAEGCKPGSYTVDNGKMIALSACYDEELSNEVSGADPVTGKKSWTFKLPAKYKVAAVYSLDPVVLDIGNQDKKERAIVVLGPDGKQRATVNGEGGFATECDNGLFVSVAVCSTTAVDANTLYMPTVAESGKANEIVAFDLGTGKVKWRTPAGDGRTITPIGAANGQLLAYRKATSDQGGEVVSIPAAGGTPTALLRNPSGPSAPIENGFYMSKIDYVDGRLFISQTRLLAKGTDEKLLMVFGK
ncbi:PQQ-binding-like beta-propeller repeat protein [Streptomyces sp. NBC_01443]|uniref:outer membrane protein assembly factor BamB family protein n=1 Tax=Streptomyces sp. NBC_01443 TaxID=2903868 RepID=UPI00224CC17F|nr:PQQ-binding-like beta-propeller repeat protein [Streptomyces sp. NBC_01443]MCX4629458.1 PQQ-binding-like beta-propeller repeat protein [Streptomyces sp. NBC_01443]